ncbi:TIGR00730 family Rossman fold protein [Nocardioides limicola]|uniref:LOG family protein n=1 Tax=Nocardioides limicola TaxID=2803368 RepID=UPI00193BA291|nr:TIGR00730 family Rossman fold protein [Nocardioides sp. DJM-14]
MISRLAVFLGSRDGAHPRWRQLAYDTGAGLARRDIELVYGGGGSGLMGALSQGVIDHGGRVIGVIPAFMVDREWGRVGDEPGVTTHVVETMHERKALMTELADAFLVLPGGLGTLEELFEVWTWHTLDLHAKALGLLDPAGFWDHLVTLLGQLAGHGFMNAETVEALVVERDLDAALAGLTTRLR